MVLKPAVNNTKSRSVRHLSMTCSLQEHKQFCGKEAHYEAWTNHNACLEHREWWRDARLFSAFLVLSGIAIGASVSAYLFNHDDGQSFWGLQSQNFFTRSTEQDPKIRLWNRLRDDGLQQVSAGHLKDGIALLKQAEKLTGIAPAAQAELLNDLAVAEHKAGNSVDSIVYFNRAVKLNPTMRAAQKNLMLARRLESIDTWQ